MRIFIFYIISILLCTNVIACPGPRHEKTYMDNGNFVNYIKEKINTDEHLNIMNVTIMKCDKDESICKLIELNKSLSSKGGDRFFLALINDTKKYIIVKYNIGYVTSCRVHDINEGDIGFIYAKKSEVPFQFKLPVNNEALLDVYELRKVPAFSDF